MTSLDILRRQSRWFERLTLALMIGTALVILIPTAIALIMLARDGGQWRQLAVFSLIVWLPTIFYLFALGAVRSAFSDFASGGQFGPAIANGCGRAGLALAVGAAMSAVGVPNLRRLYGADFDGGFASVGTFLHFDTAYLAVGVVGVALILLGRLLAHAAGLQSEVAELRGELDEIF